MDEHAEELGNDEEAEPVEGSEVVDDGTATDSSSTDLGKQLLLAGIGALSLTWEKAESIVDDLAKRGSDRGNDQPADDFPAPSRGGVSRATDRASSAMSGLFREVGLVTEPTIEDLELRVAQLEHRLRILERKAAQAAPGAPPEARP